MLIPFCTRVLELFALMPLVSDWCVRPRFLISAPELVVLYAFPVGYTYTPTLCVFTKCCVIILKWHETKANEVWKLV